MWPLAFIAQRLCQEWKGEDWVRDLTWSNSVEEGRRRLLFLEGVGGRRWKGKRSLTYGARTSVRQRERECGRARGVGPAACWARPTARSEGR
jgi:hypothetical protein